MFRLCLVKPTGASTLVSRAAMLMTIPTAGSLQSPHRAYATAHQSTRSCAKRRRYYTDPLRTPQTGVRTVVGRSALETSTSAVNAAGDVDPSLAEEVRMNSTATPAGAGLDTTTRCLTVRPSPKVQLMRILSAHGRTVRYDSDGVPVEGSWFLLPWHEQMRILAAVVAALCLTKAFFDVVRFELLYYGVWKVGYRNDNSFTKRVLYYGSTALLAAGLLFSFNLNFFLSAWVVGRREIAAHMVCNGFAHVMPHRAVQLIKRRVKLSFV